VLVQAAPESKSELGVERWGVSSDSTTGETIVHGYGAKNEAVVELHHRYVNQDASHAAIEIALSGSRGAARMRIDVDAQPTGNADDHRVEMTIGENEFAESPDAQNVLAHMSTDLGTGMPEVSPGASSLLSPKVHPENLLGCDTELVQKCSGPLLSAGAVVALSSSSCAHFARAQAVVLLCQTAGQVVGGSIVGTVGAAGGGVVGGVGGLGVGAVPGALLGGAAGIAAGEYLGGAFGNQLCNLVTGSSKLMAKCAQETYEAARNRALHDECAKAAPACLQPTKERVEVGPP
jgi:hypothetical protein